MKIVTITASFAQADVPTALACLKTAQVDALQSADCLKYQIYVDAEASGKIFVIHMWNNDTSFEAYRTSDLFGKTIAELGPLMTTAPESLSYDAQQMN
jgi:quinol monooxygenase YgiN